VSDDVLNIWNKIAEHWDEQVGEGNDFQKQLVMPATTRLLEPKPGQRVLDACCGNGNYSRRLGRMGSKVLAFDGAARFIELARARTVEADGVIRYEVADACDQAAVLALAKPMSFDAAVCSFAVMDLPTIAPLFRAVRSLVKPGGRFVFSLGHPAFHTNESKMIARQDHGEGEPTQSFGVEVMRYANDWPHKSRGLLNQPEAHWIYHRSLSTVLRECFEAGFVVDGMEEPTFEPDTRARSPFAWARRTDIPPAIVIRLR
jgi:SAM-dependent methyltransferase